MKYQNITEFEEVLKKYEHFFYILHEKEIDYVDFIKKAVAFVPMSIIEYTNRKLNYDCRRFCMCVNYYSPNFPNERFIFNDKNGNDLRTFTINENNIDIIRKKKCNEADYDDIIDLLNTFETEDSDENRGFIGLLNSFYNLLGTDSPETEFSVKDYMENNKYSFIIPENDYFIISEKDYKEGDYINTEAYLKDNFNKNKNYTYAIYSKFLDEAFKITTNNEKWANSKKESELFYQYNIPIYRTLYTKKIIANIVIPILIGNEEKEEPPIENLLESITALSKQLFNTIWQYESEIRIKQESIKSAISAIMSRNMSHNLGSHVISGTKNYLSNKNFNIYDNGVEKGVYRLFQYLQERMDFISVIINSAHNGYSFYAPLNLKADILDEIAADGRDRRHGCNGNKTLSFLLENIVKSEDVVRYDAENEKKLEIMLLRIVPKCKIRQEGKDIFSFTSESNGDNNTNDFNDIDFSIPFGINSRHAFLTIIENYIRNSAKHNKNYSQGVDTLLISIMVEERKIKDNEGNDIDGYEITIFDNKNISKDTGNEDNELNILKGKLKSVKILDTNNALDTNNKGFKEMLLCAAWLRNDYADWSIIEQKSGKQDFLLKFDKVDLSNIKNRLWFKDIDANETDSRIKEMANDRKKKIEAYTDGLQAFGVKFWLPKHQLIYYKELENKDDVYNFPSADYYAINVKGNDFLKAEIECRLSNIIFVESDEISRKNLTEQRQFIVNEYKKKHPEWENTEIIVSYNTHPRIEDKQNKGSWNRANDLYRITKMNELPELTGQDACIFNRHNDTPSTFDTTFSKFSKKYPNHLKFVEGISGGSFNYNLLINAPLDKLDKFRVLKSCFTKIAIIDERIYDKYGCQVIGAGDITLSKIKEYNDEIIAYRKNGTELSSDCKNYIYINIVKEDDNKYDKWIKSKKLITAGSKMANWLRMKNIFVYNCIKLENGYELVGLDGERLNKLPCDIEYISTHYGIIQKMETEKEKTDLVGAYKAFLTTLGLDNRCKVAIHSGRGGVVDKQKEVTFIPLSTIEAQLEDCKYKLAQLFLNLKYKPIIE